MTQVYHLDARGALATTSEHDDTTPLALATNQTTTPPPEYDTDTEVALYRGGWVTVDRAEYERFVQDETLIARRTELRAAVARARWARQAEGYEHDGVVYDATMSSVAEMSAVIQFMERTKQPKGTPPLSVSWKAKNGSWPRTTAQLSAASMELGTWIQRLFKWEGDLLALIDAADTVADLNTLRVDVQDAEPQPDAPAEPTTAEPEGAAS